MEIVFLPPAKGKFTEAISYYNDQSEGLGYEFAAEVKRTLERIVQYPAMLGLSFQIVLIVAGPIDFLMESFIKVRKETLLIVAVMHLSREPETWKSRLKKKEL